MRFKQPQAKDLNDLIKINDIAKSFGLDPVDFATIQNVVVFENIEHIGIPSFERMRKTITHTLLEWLNFSRPVVGYLVLSWFIPPDLLVHKPNYGIRCRLVQELAE